MITGMELARRLPNEASNQLTHLSEQGFCVLRDIVPPAAIADLSAGLDPCFRRTPFCEGGFYGERTKRFGSLLRRSRHAEALVRHELVLAMTGAVLGPWCDTIQLNLTQAIEIHPGALPQLPHRDQDMWRGEIGTIEYLVNVMWPLHEYREENGATLIWPNSHGKNALRADSPATPIVVECDPGSAVLFLGSTLHGAGGNRSDAPRRGLIVSYCLGWLKPYENQWLVYPPSVARKFDPELSALAGYIQHRPNLGNYEGRCPSILFENSIPEHLGGIDTLLPDQTSAVAKFVAAQQTAPPDFERATEADELSPVPSD
ncbi:MAG TPA: phytanoyl-CoA dioxygenase family protein [Methylocella sp.]|nr:phytanoyl-CoA dioxygenase family protein [Methylocella sp.]